MMYMISRQGAKEIMDKYLLRDGRWNLLVCAVHLLPSSCTQPAHTWLRICKLAENDRHAGARGERLRFRSSLVSLSSLPIQLHHAPVPS